mmetsp:Transcript_1883/g.4647  ORF Transcript_1883/g.4647 Transcript_1883/m.4647 type:complete len:407 (-) Transcript_1883:419-1639(-)|eukprot:CAMPEP_0119566774 /NCGR_PEP_ID=MMETSP1352-20130426/34062_1 /TAXON_ID=265584 /ORGANISM="Stauroneis constricta, Strain CCMP1120" /LENGTH=406 /DNA_ID=CAMNT_0007615939 /DNA_START=190 /DNA_END=1413 /DNA_ORIENTATION=-
MQGQSLHFVKHAPRMMGVMGGRGGGGGVVLRSVRAFSVHQSSCLNGSLGMTPGRPTARQAAVHATVLLNNTASQNCGNGSMISQPSEFGPAIRFMGTKSTGKNSQRSSSSSKEAKSEESNATTSTPNNRSNDDPIATGSKKVTLEEMTLDPPHGPFQSHVSTNGSNFNDDHTDSFHNHTSMTYTAQWDRYVYAHPLSQIILEYLQDHHHLFLQQHGLTLLRLHRDGSFELLQDMEAIVPVASSQKEVADARATTKDDANDTVTTAAAGETPLDATLSNDDDADKKATDSDASQSADMNTRSSRHSMAAAESASKPKYGPLRIWTSYDEMEKKHWLTVQHVETEDTLLSVDNSTQSTNNNNNPPLYRRFLLQDNLLPAWHGNSHRTSLPTRIHESVNQLIASIAHMA